MATDKKSAIRNLKSAIESPWPIPPLIDREEDQAWFGWILDMNQRDVQEVLKATRSGDDPSTRLIYEFSGLEVLVHLWKNHMSTSLYIAEKPLNELRKRYVRKNYDPARPETCTKTLAHKLRVSEQFVREALSEDAREDPRQTKMFAEKS